MATPDIALALAGFALGHAVFTVRDNVTTEPMTPFAVVQRGEKRDVIRFASSNMEEAVHQAELAMKKATADADGFAFITEGRVNSAEGKTDVFLVHFWQKGMSQPGSLVQKFEPYSKQKTFK